MMRCFVSSNKVQLHFEVNYYYWIVFELLYGCKQFLVSVLKQLCFGLIHVLFWSKINKWAGGAIRINNVLV